MRRRQFINTIGAATVGSAVGASTAVAGSTVEPLEFDSTASLLDGNGNYLTDDSLVAVWAEDTALNEDADDDGDAVYYDTNTPIPLVAVDGSVVGFGAKLVLDDANFKSGNEEFLLNVWDAKLSGSGTVLYDEGHDQFSTLTDFTSMANYAENNGYTVTATSTLADDLSGADAAWITTPPTAFSSSEKKALADFVKGGGAVFLHDRADYSNYDETANLNDVAKKLKLQFRFNDDQVTDDTNNGGTFYKPTTTQFNTAFDFFADRSGMGIHQDQTYTVDVIDVADGDTVDIRFDSGREENVRILGVDTPEKEQYQQYEREQEWEGIESLTYLADWATSATDFAKTELGSETVDVSFDSAEAGIFDQFDRLLGYIHYDADGDGTRDEFYNYRLVEQGYARLYSSAFTNHESFYDAEATAQANSRRVWTDSDPENSTEYRNRDVGDLFFPNPATVRTSAGGVADDRVPVYAESSASQTLDGGHDYGSDDLPLVGVDETAGVAVVGGLTLDESYEKEEDFAVDTSDYENFVVTTNLVDYLSSLSGDVLIDGGHGQFTADHALGSEDAAYYQRHLEGFDVSFEQVNSGYASRLSNARAILVTPPDQAFTSSEVDALQGHLDDGGAVVLMGGGDAPADARSNLNDLASALGTDLRLNADDVSDDTNNVNSDSSIPTTTVFDTSFPLFSAYSSGGGTGELAVASVSESGSTLNEEYVVFENTGDADLDLTGYSVEDEAGYSYTFPDGFTLTPGAQVTLHTGSGTDTDTDLYWGSGSYVWNDDGDTVYVYDDSGTQVLSHTYGSTGSPNLTVASVSESGDTLNEEYVVFENTGDADLDMTGYVCEDEAGYDYVFPDGFTLAAGSTVTLHTGSGTDTDTDLYWGSGIYVWNDGGDTVHVYDDAGSLVVEYTYPQSTTSGDLAVANVHADAEGDDWDNLNDEYVDFENTGDSGIDMTGYVCEDEAGNSYTFPDGFTLSAGAQVRLHSGSGTDSSTDLYWASGSPIWNNSGDTVYVYDDTGSLIVEYPY